MNWLEVGAGAVAAWVLVWFMAPPLGRYLEKRRRKPMPPLVRRIPGKPVDGEPLDPVEIAHLLAIRCTIHHDEAEDPMEGRTV